MDQEKIFISYKRKDKDMVESLVKRIEETTGIKCWMDITGIESKAQFESKICSAIDRTSVVLFMYSNTHTSIDLENDYTVKELNYARNYTGNTIILVNLDRTPLYDIFAFQFGSKNNIDATDNDQVNKLCIDLGKIVKNDGETAQKAAKNYSKNINTKAKSDDDHTALIFCGLGWFGVLLILLLYNIYCLISNYVQEWTCPLLYPWWTFVCLIVSFVFVGISCSNIFKGMLLSIVSLSALSACLLNLDINNYTLNDWRINVIIGMLIFTLLILLLNKDSRSFFIESLKKW